MKLISLFDANQISTGTKVTFARTQQLIEHQILTVASDWSGGCLAPRFTVFQRLNCKRSAQLIIQICGGNSPVHRFNIVPWNETMISGLFPKDCLTWADVLFAPMILHLRHFFPRAQHTPGLTHEANREKERGAVFGTDISRECRSSFWAITICHLGKSAAFFASFKIDLDFFRTASPSVLIPWLFCFRKFHILFLFTRKIIFVLCENVTAKSSHEFPHLVRIMKLTSLIFKIPVNPRAQRLLCSRNRWVLLAFQIGSTRSSSSSAHCIHSKRTFKKFFRHFGY